MPAGWDDGVWIRGIMQMPAYEDTARNLVVVAMIALPVFLLLTALGGWMIIRRTFPAAGTYHTYRRHDQRSTGSVRPHRPASRQR